MIAHIYSMQHHSDKTGLIRISPITQHADGNGGQNAAEPLHRIFSIDVVPPRRDGDSVRELERLGRMQGAVSLKWGLALVPEPRREAERGIFDLVGH